MHKDEARRYPTVDALIRDVDRYFADEPLEARPDAVGYRLSKLMRRNRTAFLTAALVLTTIVGLVVFWIGKMLIKEPPAAEVKTCPFCKEANAVDASKCKACTSAI